jgi:5,10-methylenetetrahydromethanopterin reductase
MTRMKISATDTAAWAAGSWQAIPQTTLTGRAADIGSSVRDIAAQDITEIIYQPIGPDDLAELAAFRLAARSATCAA